MKNKKILGALASVAGLAAVATPAICMTGCSNNKSHFSDIQLVGEVEEGSWEGVNFTFSCQKEDDATHMIGATGNISTYVNGERSSNGALIEIHKWNPSANAKDYYVANIAFDSPLVLHKGDKCKVVCEIVCKSHDTSGEWKVHWAENITFSWITQ